MKTPFSRSDEDWYRAWDKTRFMVQLNDGSWISEESLVRLPPVELERLKQSQRGRPMDLIGLDFETYGSVSLPDHGLDRYISDQYFRPLIASISYDDLGREIRHTFDFVENFDDARRGLAAQLGFNTRIAVHNAGFEKAVLDWLQISVPYDRFIDSAVVARAAGAASKLEAAAPQLLGIEKMEMGRDLIKLFSIPGKYQEKYGSMEFHPDVVLEHPAEWKKFKEYCELDASLSRRIANRYLDYLSPNELAFQALTMRMNSVGWPVDVAAVEEMQRRYLENQAAALELFRSDCDAEDLNLNSLPQLKEWCAERGVKASSFDEKHVERMLKAIGKKLNGMLPDDPKHEDYAQVYQLLATKQTLGGSSLKKLQVILDRVGHDGRLRDQYLHCGAGQTLRTTGTGVQMQNLPRLSGELLDVATLYDDAVDWTNTEMADNLRQVFTSSDPNGLLLVGDFSSVESRGLAWIAGEEWKLEAYRQGRDMYKVLAERILGTPYDLVTKSERTFGKVGELGCGYGAGGPAVREFADGMGVELTEAEAARLVYDWRDANPKVTELWDQLNRMLQEIVFGDTLTEYCHLPDGFLLLLSTVRTPESLIRQHPGAKSVRLTITRADGGTVMHRVFHGCYRRGRNVGYYKPSDRKTGDLWKNWYIDSKTKQKRFYELYGGKLAGIVTQSFCREIFFRTLREVQRWADTHRELTVIGQFHDEIVVDKKPSLASVLVFEQDLKKLMSDPGEFKTFPLAAEVKSAYRYIK